MADPLKDQINAGLVETLAQRLGEQSTSFNRQAFLEEVAPRLGALELKDRINLIADAIATGLPLPYPEALDVVVAVADDDVDPWAAWPLCSFVERHGVDHPEESLAAMPELTKRWSCEFAIRPFLEQHLALTRSHLRAWTDDADEAVRRLASEGTRPFLPWGPRVAALIDDPQIGLELLDRLRLDPSESVRRSVANHLNDVAKLDADLVVAVLHRWMSDDPPPDHRMVRHSLRTLVKNGHRGALELLGFTTDPQIAVNLFECRPPTIDIDSTIELAAEIVSTAGSEQRLVVDFVIHHVNAAGATSAKVFKWTTIELEPGQATKIGKRRRIAHASTRTYHPGVHRIDLQIGGTVFGSTQFDLANT